MRLRTIVVLVSRKIVVLTIIAALAVPAASQEKAQTSLDERLSGQENRRHEDAALAELQHLSFLDPALIVAWNRTVNEIAFAEDQFFTFKGVRAHAMMHIAIHDALNAVIPAVSAVRIPRRRSLRSSDRRCRAGGPRRGLVAISGPAGETGRGAGELAFADPERTRTKRAESLSAGRVRPPSLPCAWAMAGIFRARTLFRANPERIRRRHRGTVLCFNRGSVLRGLSACAAPTSSARRLHQSSTAKDMRRRTTR